MKELLPGPTERLFFRRITQDDLDFIATMMSHPDVMRFYPKRYTREESQQWLDRQLLRYERDGHGLWLVSEQDSGQPVGQIGLMMQEVDGKAEPEIGYLLHFPYWKKGYAVEAAAAVRDLAFQEMHLPYVISLIRPENTPSQAVARKLGMTPVRETFFHGYRHLVFHLTA